MDNPILLSKEKNSRNNVNCLSNNNNSSSSSIRNINNNSNRREWNN